MAAKRLAAALINMGRGIHTETVIVVVAGTNKQIYRKGDCG